MRLARQQRRNMSPAEVRLWNRLRRSPCGIGFRRQHPIGPYSADFYCPVAKLVIEIDGLIHDFAAQAEHDERRNAYIRELGLQTVRIAASDVMRDADAAAGALIALCAEARGPSTTQLG
jgi:very-short-patch-repair endonuclease